MREMQDISQDAPKSEEQWLELMGLPNESQALNDYVEALANRELRRYRSIVQGGKKEGQTYYGHILDGVMTLGRIGRLKPMGITSHEERCLYLAYTVHDINKVPGYGNKAYVDVATDENIRAELESLDASSFFSDWQKYLHDIAGLARLHQAHLAVTIERLEERKASPEKRYLLDEQAQPGRVQKLGHLIQAVDELALSKTLDERPFKDKFIFSLNSACATEQYQFVTHRLSEHRGVLTNVIHNGVVAHLREKYPACLDLLYYPDGVAYLFPKRASVIWNDEDIEAVARRVAQRLAELQSEQLGQFIKGRPFGIAVDNAAIESGATPHDLLGAIYFIVARKRYAIERETQREADVRADLQAALSSGKLSFDTGARVESLLTLQQLLAPGESHIRCGEYATAYRNLVNDHSAALGLNVKDAWEHLYQTLELPVENYALYNIVNPYRRGFFIVRDLPTHLTNIDALHDRFLEVLHAVTEGSEEDVASQLVPQGKGLVECFVDYLRRTLLVSAVASRHDFSGYLREYVTLRNRQCCNCSTMLPTSDWMTANVPASIGVQSFSNHLAGGSLREPKRQICPICRAQFILEKIAWVGHSSKMGLPKTSASGSKTPGYSTFYLYLYPYNYFTEPFLDAWMAEIERLRAQDSTAFYINFAKTFREWMSGNVGRIAIRPTKANGVALPRLAEASRNIPILPINAPGQNYGAQFLVALQKAVLLRAFFGCRVVLSRLPTAPIDTTALQTLFVDGLPRNLLPLIAGPSEGAALYQHEANLTNEQVQALEQRLQQLHQLNDILYTPGSDRDLVHDLAVELGDESLRLYFVLDRIIEEKTASEGRGGGKNKGITPEQRATMLSRKVVPIARQLIDSMSI